MPKLGPGTAPGRATRFHLACVSVLFSSGRVESLEQFWRLPSGVADQVTSPEASPIWAAVGRQPTAVDAPGATRHTAIGKPPIVGGPVSRPVQGDRSPVRSKGPSAAAGQGCSSSPDHDPRPLSRASVCAAPRSESQLAPVATERFHPAGSSWPVIRGSAVIQGGSGVIDRFRSMGRYFRSYTYYAALSRTFGEHRGIRRSGGLQG